MPPFPPPGVLRQMVAQGKANKIGVTTNGDEGDERPPTLIITYPNSDHWASVWRRAFGQYIQVELKDRSINISHYSYENLVLPVYNMNWDFLGSSSGSTWDLLDRHVNDSVMGLKLKNIFPCKRGEYRFFRILNTGVNHYYDVPMTDIRHCILYVRNLDLFDGLQVHTAYLHHFIHKNVRLIFTSMIIIVSHE